MIWHIAPQKTNPSRPGPYDKNLRINPDYLNLEGVKFPMEIDQIEHFVKLNPQLFYRGLWC